MSNAPGIINTKGIAGQEESGSSAAEDSMMEDDEDEALSGINTNEAHTTDYGGNPQMAKQQTKHLDRQ